MSSRNIKIDVWIYFALILLAIEILLLATLYSRPGGLVGIIIYYWTPRIIPALAFILFVIAILTFIVRRSILTRWRIIGLVCCVILFFSDSLYYHYPSSYDNWPSKVNFRLPLDTTITVGAGGNNRNINHHVIAPDQCWGYDLCVTRDGKLFSGDSTKLSNYFGFGLPIISPAHGVVVKIENNDPDMPPGQLGGGSNACGNYVIIEVADNEYLFICHMKKRSVQVKVGDIVSQGQLLGLVGNSGNTSAPHIHMHLQDTKILHLGEGIPLCFSNYLADGEVIDRGIPKGGFDENDNLIGQQVQNIH